MGFTIDPISLGIKAGFHLFGAHKAAKAAKEAAQIQTDYGNKALGVRGQMYDRAAASLAPWQAAGAGAMAQLAQRSGIPMIGPNGPVNPADVSSGAVSLGSFAPPPVAPPNMAPTPGRDRGNLPPQGTAVPRNGVPPQGATVMMVAPDGQEQIAVPAAHVEHYKSRGGRVVGGGY